METNWNQLIERYLNGELSAEGKSAFEQELAANPELQKELELHQLTQNLIKRAAVRNMVQQSAKQFHFRNNLIKASIITVITAALALAVYLAMTVSTSKSDQTEQDVLEGSFLENLNKELTFENIDPQYFKFTGENDIFLSESGVLLSITDGSFLLDGKPYRGEAIVQWQEAQQASDIVKAGLSTKSGEKLLETQGMFSLNAFTPDGKKLTLTDEGIYVQVPVDELKKDMMLFNGVQGKNGIDWQNPVELERLPKPKDMAQMDLFPPTYEPKLNELKWFTDKAKRDSLYLSFEETLIIENDSVSVPIQAQQNFSKTNQVELRIDDKLANRTINPIFNTDGNVVISNPSYTFVDYPLATRSWYGTAGISYGETYDLNFYQSMLDDDHARLLVEGKVYSNKQISKHRAGDLLGLNGDYPLLTITEYLSEQNVVNGIVELSAVYDVELKKKGKLSQPAVLTMNISDVGIITHDIDIDFELKYSSDRSTQNLSRNKSHIPPSKVLAIWDKKFDNTILATQDFEDRMKTIHNTCDERVFDLYVKNLNEPLWKLDERVVKLGYPEFQQFADQKVGAIQIDNEHQKNIAAFYDLAIKTIRSKGKDAMLSALKKDREWDNEVSAEQEKEVIRKGLRESVNLNEEYEFNLANVGKQLGKTLGFQMHGGGTIVNIDKYVWDATVARQSTVITDPETGKTAQITYHPMSLEVKESKKYNRLYLYLFSKEINSYQRLDITAGKLNYNLNGDMNYNAAIIGINEDGYYYDQLDQLEAKDLGAFSLKKISETEFDKKINALNKNRTTKPMDLKYELSWLFKEQANYKVQKKRRDMIDFRAALYPTIYPCGQGLIEGAPSQDVLMR